MTRLKALKLANAVKVGPGEETFFRENAYEIYFVDQIVISITHKQAKHTTYTSIFNAIYWDQEDKSGSTKAKDNLIKAKGINE